MDQNNTQNSSGMMNGMPPQMPQPEKKVGPIVGALIIIIILVAAGLYFFAQKLNTENPPVQNAETSTDTSANSTDDTNPTGANASQSSNVTVASQMNEIKSMQAELDAELADVDYSF